MTPAEELVLHLVNLLAAASFLFLAASRDAILLYSTRFNRVPVHTSWLSGQQWIDELVNGHDRRFHNELGLRKHTFNKLIRVLGRDAGLVDTRHVSAEEQLAIFLHYAHRGLSNRALQERFQRSADTVTKYASHVPIHVKCRNDRSHRCIHRILNALTLEKVYGTYVKLPTRNSPVPAEIRKSGDFWPFFRDCIGAIDGSHIPAFVPESMRVRFRDRKGQISQNVLAACSMNMEFLYVLPGWEGSAADSRVFENARRQDFRIPDGRYYLADAGYGNCDALLVPYRGVRYHLKEWGTSANRLVLIRSCISGIMTMSSPQNHKELFNFRHARLRNVIERIFGVVKRRFKVLVIAQEYSPEMQSRLISGLAVIHNFIRAYDPSDLPEDSEMETVTGLSGEVERMTANLADQAVGSEERNRAAERRDTIALAMWDDYQRNQRGRRARRA